MYTATITLHACRNIFSPICFKAPVQHVSDILNMLLYVSQSTSTQTTDISISKPKITLSQVIIPDIIMTDKCVKLVLKEQKIQNTEAKLT